tara:strand:- start:1454 stop:2470 length:1017 start_codon:yes stop_codon:yes gene_type:complete
MSSHIRLFIISFSLAIFMTFAAKVSLADNHEAITDGVSVVFDAQARAVGTFADDNVSEFDLGNARLGASFNKSILDGRVSVQYDGTDLDLLDASVSLPLFGDKLNAKVGRFLIPAGRNAMQDIYDWTTWQGANVINKWSSLNGYGRRDGAAFTGVLDEEKAVISYNFGVFNGEDDEALFAGRADITVKDPLVDGLTFGVALQAQDGYLGFGVDAVYTRDITYGTLTVDGAFNRFDLDDAPYTPNVGQNAGSGFSVGSSLLVNKIYPIASVKIQPEPFFRYQKFDYSDGFDGSRTRIDAGANLLLVGFEQTKLAVNYFRNEDRLDETDDGVYLGVQFAF